MYTVGIQYWVNTGKSGIENRDPNKHKFLYFQFVSYIIRLHFVDIIVFGFLNRLWPIKFNFLNFLWPEFNGSK